MRSPRAVAATALGVDGPGGRPAADLALVAGVAAIALVAGAFAVRSLQAAVAIALIVLLLAIYSESRRAGLFTLWSLWLIAPGLRRILALASDAPAADPLALLPFVATGLLAMIELRRSRMTRGARTTLAVAALGMLLGAPAGMIADPLAFGFGMIAYLAGLSAFALGWADIVEERRLSLLRVLAVVVPPLAAYGILQYFFPLSAWDANWVETVDLGSIGSPQEGHIRIFSTLNSPGTFAIVLVLAILLGLGARGRLGSRLAVLLPLIVALALTFVRSAWLALVVGLLVYAAAARGRAAGRIVVVVAVCLVGLFVVGGSNPTTRAFTERVTSLGDLDEDVSAQERLQFTDQLLPTALAQPLGAGVGQAGLSVRLDASTDADSLTTTDNGYLALLYQVGLAGFLLVCIAFAASVVTAVRGLAEAVGDQRQIAIAILTVLVTLLVAQASGDMLYGVTGAIFWYVAGAAFAVRRVTAEEKLAAGDAPAVPARR